jgi:hypothetical protein
VERDYDLFERLEDHSVVWRGSVHGLEGARRKLRELATRTTNECLAIHTPTRQVVALENIGRAVPRLGKRVVFQIAYDEHLLQERAKLLEHNGYEIISLLGNEAAKVVLSSRQYCDLFIVGHAAPEQTRKEIVDWLRAKYPSVRILALNPPDHQGLAGADYNVPWNSPNAYLATIAAAVS